MCFQCAGWYPISEFTAEVLGLDHSLPFWIAASHRNALIDIMHEITDPGCNMGKRTSYQIVLRNGVAEKELKYSSAYDWLDAHSPSYAQTILSYESRGYTSVDVDNDRMVDMRALFLDRLALRDSGQNLPDSGLRLWTGPGTHEVHLRVGRVNVLESNIKPEYVSRPELQKFIRLLVKT